GRRGGDCRGERCRGFVRAGGARSRRVARPGGHRDERSGARGGSAGDGQRIGERRRVVAKGPIEKKPRVYEVAKDLGMSSEAVLQIAKKLGVEVKNHMSTLATETVDKIRGEISHGAAVVKEEQARKHEIE